MTKALHCDVLIAGGGLTGQSLARQLKIARPELSVAVIERERRPLPEAAFKVGEATSELGAHYFSEKLALRDHLQSDHLLKCGLRFFFGDSHASLLDRPEYGPKDFPPIESFQLDRGRLENHLRGLNEAAGAVLWEGFEVQDIELGQDDGQPHTTIVSQIEDGTSSSITSKWVVDCTGRRRMLQKKLGLCVASPLHHSACWFRMAGKCDVADLVRAFQCVSLAPGFSPVTEAPPHTSTASAVSTPGKKPLKRLAPPRHASTGLKPGANEKDVQDRQALGLFATDLARWHDRVPGGIRYRSTNHLVGHGYWVWLIPLSSGNTSIGIVVDERIHPVANLDTPEKAFDWLKFNEPALAKHLSSFRQLDFGCAREFSYDTARFVSPDRWACVGESAAFLDPFYSPGADFTAIGNTLVTKLIVRDFDLALTNDAAEQANATLLLLHRAFTQVFLDQYPTFGHTRVMSAKILWDNSSYWVFVCQMFFQDVPWDDAQLERYCRVFERYHRLNVKVQQLFRDWARMSRDKTGYEYLGYADFPIAARSHLELGKRKSAERCVDWVESNLDRFSAWAVVLFQIAVEDVAPEFLDGLREELLTPDSIDLNNLERATEVTATKERARRNPLLPEFAALKRQMRKLFPECACLRPGGDSKRAGQQLNEALSPARRS